MPSPASGGPRPYRRGGAVRSEADGRIAGSPPAGRKSRAFLASISAVRSAPRGGPAGMSCAGTRSSPSTSKATSSDRASASGGDFCVMTATVFDELRRYARFEAADEANLRAFAPTVAPHFARIVDELYARSLEHETAARVFTRAEQVENPKRALPEWFGSFFRGP